MTVLQRTDLTTSQKIECAAAALAGQHACCIPRSFVTDFSVYS